MNKQSNFEPEMRPEYDLAERKGVRGKYYDAYQRGHTVNILHEDGTTTTQYFTLEDGAILLAPDVREYFPDSDSVNTALRTIIGLVQSNSRNKDQEAIKAG